MATVKLVGETDMEIPKTPVLKVEKAIYYKTDPKDAAKPIGDSHTCPIKPINL